MKLKLVKTAKGVQSGVFFWETGDGKERKKVFKSLGKEDTMDVPDQDGHEIMAKYKGLFEVVHYGDAPPKEKATVSPRTKVVKQEIKK